MKMRFRKQTALAPIATASSLCLLLLNPLGAFADDCAAPDTPEMPDGSSATMEKMLEGQKAFKAFQSANVDYMQCLEDVFEDAEKAAGKAKDSDTKKAAEETYASAVNAYNAAVTAEEELADSFNAAIRAYKAANK